MYKNDPMRYSEPMHAQCASENVSIKQPEHIEMADYITKLMIHDKMLRPAQIVEVLDVVKNRAMEYYQDRIACAQKELESIRIEAEPLFR